MTLTQNIGFFTSIIYMFYILWWKFNGKIFFEKKLLLINIIISSIYAFIGLSLNYSIQSAGFLIPISLIFVIHVMNLLSLALKKRQFEAEYYRGSGELIDKLFTLIVIFLTVILPVFFLSSLIS
ncbi:hypothetical protein [Flavobacterium suncheonense]|nr:hypothetical protein [Flavobacterium suncheonense]